MSFPRYPIYKASGVEWLGQVPEDWHVDRIKWSAASCQNGIWGDEAKQDENDIPCVRVADFDRQRLRVELSEPTVRNITAKERSGRVLNQGDLLLEKSGGGETQPVGCVVLYDDPQPAVCSNFVARVKVAAGMNASFWRYLHAAAYAVRLNTRSIKQTSGIQNLDASQYFDERAGFPSPAEQTAIAAFLDQETAKIDDLVAEQQRLMELLKEKRQAVISHAVTKGVNPNAPMKPSGIEWLGDVPKHWKTTKVGFVASVTRGTGYQNVEEVDEAEDAIQMIRISDFNDFDPIWVKNSSTLDSYKVDSTDLLIAGTGASAGITMRVTKEMTGMIHSYNAPRIRCWNIEPEFLYFVLNSQGIKYQEDLLFTGSAQHFLDMSSVSKLELACCDLSEQKQIVKFLNERLGQLDTLNAEAQRAIDLLQERRTALISAAVTGQIDVRPLLTKEAA